VLLLDWIEQSRIRDGRIIFLGAHSDDVVGWQRFFAEAAEVAAWLQTSRGVGRGGRVVILGLPSRPMVTALVGTWMAGASVTCAPTPARNVDLAAYLEQTRRRLAALGDPLILLGDPYGSLAGPLIDGGAEVVPLPAIPTTHPGEAWKMPELTADDAAILQFTSGTTAAPKIVRVSHGNLAANITAIKERHPHDVVDGRGAVSKLKVAHGHEPVPDGCAVVHGRMLSWLPLSHDMGLIGGLATLLTCGSCDLLLGSPMDYLASPASWMRNAARYRVTNIVGPVSAYAMAGRLLRTGPLLDLSWVKTAASGGEPVEPDVAEGFLDDAARHGLRRDVFNASYGLAEATLAVTMPGVGEGLQVDVVDADVLAEQQFAAPAPSGRKVRRFARLGTPISRTQVRIVDPDSGARCPERAVGEIQVAGPSVARYLDDEMSGTYGRTADGWLTTGDLGYLAEGELVVCGRAKDLIIVGGRNLHPEEVEHAVAVVPGVRPGNVVAFATRSGGTDSVTVAFELRAGHDEHDVRRQVKAAVLGAIGILPATVHALPPGSIPKTPSGKLQRAEAARLWGVGQ
jgi:fatty-acyl-CoA synthase